MAMKVLDGDGSAFYVDAEGAGSVGDPAKLIRVFEGGYRQIKVEITRPANEIPYSAYGAVADNAPSITTQVLSGIARKNNGSGAIVSVEVMTDKVSWTSGLEMVVYNAAPAGGFVADNAPFDTKYVDKASLIRNQSISIPAFQTKTGAAGGIRSGFVDGLNIPFQCVGDVDDLYFQFYIPSGSTPTPASAQKFYVVVGVIQD